MKDNFPPLALAVIILMVLCGVATIALALPVFGLVVPFP